MLICEMLVRMLEALSKSPGLLGVEGRVNILTGCLEYVAVTGSDGGNVK